jgi:hypothetical protein
MRLISWIHPCGSETKVKHFLVDVGILKIKNFYLKVTLLQKYSEKS